MKKFMDWMTDKFAPRMNKLARNPWIASVQEISAVSRKTYLQGCSDSTRKHTLKRKKEAKKLRK